jgi:hypothetical protein
MCAQERQMYFLCGKILIFLKNWFRIYVNAAYV